MTRREMLPNFYAIYDALRWTGRRIRPLLPGLALLLVLIYTIANARAGRALQQELGLIRAQGAPLSLREAAPPPVPDDQNAARVYEQAFERLPRQEKSPLAGDPRYQRLAQADEKVVSNFVSDEPRRQRQVTLPQVRQALSGTEATLALLRQAAAMPHCRFPVNWEAGAGAVFPHYPKLRCLAHLLAAHAIVAATDGDTPEAAADLQAAVGIARHILAEPVMIGQLVAYSCLATAGNSLRRVMEIAPLSEAQSLLLYQTWAQVELYDSFERTVETERCLGLWAFDFTREDPSKLALLIGDEGKVVLLPYRLGPLGEPLRKMDEVYYLQFMDREVARARVRDSVRPIDRSDEERFPWYAAVSRLMAPAFDRITEKRDKALAGLALAQWALALDVYQQRTGHYPASLPEAEALAGWKLPNDPFTDSVLLYRPQSSGYLLYSVGANRRDDNGQSGRDTSHTDAPPLPQREDDIAWRLAPSG